MARDRAALESAGTQVAFVHMSTPQEADAWFAQYGVPDIVRISDPGKQLYRAFGLDEARLSSLLHPRVWWPWFRTAVIEGHGAGAAGRNWRQLTGVFLIHRGKVLDCLRHQDSTARPDYVGFVKKVLDGGA